jgi:hypothetical protein
LHAIYSTLGYVRRPQNAGATTPNGENVDFALRDQLPAERASAIGIVTIGQRRHITARATEKEVSPVKLHRCLFS